MTVSISDMTVPASKPQMLEEAQATVDKIAKNFRRGLITEEERYRAVVETWNETDAALTKVLLDGLDKYNNIFMMADSGARGSNKQIQGMPLKDFVEMCRVMNAEHTLELKESL